MTSWRIWRREGGMTMKHGQHREVRYAVPQYVNRHNWGYTSKTTIPIRCVRAESATEDLPEDRWIPSGEFPKAAFLRLYVPEEEK